MFATRNNAITALKQEERNAALFFFRRSPIRISVTEFGSALRTHYCYCIPVQDLTGKTKEDTQRVRHSVETVALERCREISEIFLRSFQVLYAFDVSCRCNLAIMAEEKPAWKFIWDVLPGTIFYFVRGYIGQVAPEGL